MEYGRRPESPEDWTEVLSRRLVGQAADADRWDAYYRGRHQLHFALPKYRAAFARLLSGFADNFCALIVDSVAERLAVEGFRLTDDPDADADAWAIWQRCGLDSGSGVAHTEALVSSRAFALVWADGDGQPVVSVEDPREVAVYYDRSDRAVPAVALKRVIDDWGAESATLWTAGEVVTLERGSVSAQWMVASRMANPLGVVPVRELANRPRLVGAPSSELEVVAPIQDAINKVMRDALLASEYAAYPQRWVTGLVIDEDENGDPKPPPFNAALDRLFVGEDPDTKFGQFAAADLGNYTALVQSLVQHLASVSRVPFHYFLLNGGQAPSGESIKSAEAGLVSKARERQTHFGEVWEDVIRLAFRVLGDPRAEASAAETIWRDAEYRTEGEHVDALLKLKSLGVPVQQLWEDAGYSPQQIERFDQMREDDARIEATSMGMAPDAVMAAAPMAALEPDDDEAPDPQQG